MEYITTSAQHKWDFLSKEVSNHHGIWIGPWWLRCFINNFQSREAAAGHLTRTDPYMWSFWPRLARQLESKRQGNKIHLRPFRASVHHHSAASSRTAQSRRELSSMMLELHHHSQSQLFVQQWYEKECPRLPVNVPNNMTPTWPSSHAYSSVFPSCLYTKISRLCTAIFTILKKKSFRLGAAVSFLLIIIVKKFFCNNIYYNWSDRRDLDCYGTAHLMKLILSRVLDQIRWDLGNNHAWNRDQLQLKTSSLLLKGDDHQSNPLPNWFLKKCGNKKKDQRKMTLWTTHPCATQHAMFWCFRVWGLCLSPWVILGSSPQVLFVSIPSLCYND